MCSLKVLYSTLEPTANTGPLFLSCVFWDSRNCCTCSSALVDSCYMGVSSLWSSFHYLHLPSLPFSSHFWWAGYGQEIPGVYRHSNCCWTTLACLLTLGARAQQELWYLPCVCVCVRVCLSVYYHCSGGMAEFYAQTKLFCLEVMPWFSYS